MITTAKKLTELLSKKKATERRAMAWSSMPSRCRIHAPSASPPMPLAGTIEIMACSASPISAVRLQVICEQNTGLNSRT